MGSSSHGGDIGDIRDDFPHEQLLQLEVTKLPWYANIKIIR